ncbi:MAG: GAF domain-containing protein, partial [Gammaproteobacteria bacterium]
MRDWAATPLGPVETWPQRLKTAVELMLDLPQMACIAWGLPNLTLLYNDAYAALLGAKHPAALGQPFAEVRSEPEVQRMVAATLGGEIQRFVDRPYEFPSRTERPAGWFTGGWTPLREESGRIVGFYAAGIETTDRVLAERSLHASEERQAFLLKLSDALRPLTDPAAIEGEACRHLAERLDVDRVYYVEIDEIAGIARVERDFVRGDAASIAGEHRVADFAWSVAILRHGECHVISDTRASELIPPADRPACSALCIIACMGAPLIKKGRLVGALCATSSHRRAWTENEVTLLREVGERIWAAVEHARAEAALRESEGRYRTLIAAMDEGVMIFERLPLRPDGLRDWRYVAMNPASQSMFGTGDLTGQSVRDNFPDEDEGWYDIYDRALEAGEVARFDREARS